MVMGIGIGYVDTCFVYCGGILILLITKALLWSVQARDRKDIVERKIEEDRDRIYEDME